MPFSPLYYLSSANKDLKTGRPYTMTSRQTSRTVVPISSGKDPEKAGKASNLPGGKNSPSKPASHRTEGSEDTRFNHAGDDESRTDKRSREAAQRYAKKAAQAKEAAVHGIHHTARDYASQKAASVKEKGHVGYEYATEKGQHVNDNTKVTTVHTGQAAHLVKEIVVLKAVKAKDASVSTGKTAAEYVGHKAVESKDLALEAMDLAVEAAGYVGHKAVEAKDAAVGAGQSTLSYLGEKVYVGHKAVEAKDAAVGAGQSTLSYLGEKAVGTKDTAREETKEKISHRNMGRDSKSSKMEFEKDEQHEDEPMEEQWEMKSGVLGALVDTFVGIAHEAQELLRWP